MSRALRELAGAIAGDALDPSTTTAQLTPAVADAGQLARLPELAARVAEVLPRAWWRPGSSRRCC